MSKSKNSFLSNDKHHIAENNLTPANIVTLIRICLVPVFVVCLLSPWPEWFSLHEIVTKDVKAWISACIFIFISCTDWIDGYLARSRNEITTLGKLLDPLADKILVAAALIALVELQIIPSWPVIIILAREFIVSGIRMVAASKGLVIAASWYGKAKTVVQIIAIVLFIVKGDGYHLNSPESILYVISWVVMIIALVLTVLSMINYVSNSIPILMSRSRTKQNVNNKLNQLAIDVVNLASEKNITLGCAESLTGGMIGAAITSVSGSSNIFKGSCVSYVNSIKHNVLGVSQSILDTSGAVSSECAQQMAEGASKLFNVEISVAVTGIAGPGGAEKDKPVGTVYIALYANGLNTSKKCQFSGDRDNVRILTTIEALRIIYNTLIDM